MRYAELRIDVDFSDAERALCVLIDEGLSVEERDPSTLLKPEPGRALLVVYCTPEEAPQRRQLIVARMGEAGIELRLGSSESDEEDWRDKWKLYFQPREIGRFAIVPTFAREYVRKTAEISITLDPGRAFGTGGHASTRLCLDAIGRIDAAVQRVLDVGCGSGILAIGGLLRWPDARAIAVDVDPEAIEVTDENAAMNGVAARLTASTTPLASIDGVFDLVAANITAETLAHLGTELAAHLSKTGTLVTSGILVEQAAQVERDLSRRGLVRVDYLVEDEWCAIVYQHQRRHERDGEVRS